MVRRSKRSQLGRRKLLLGAVLAIVTFAAACSGEDQSQSLEPAAVSRVSPAIVKRNEGPPTISFVAPLDGAVLTSPFEVEVKTEHFDLAPAGFSRDGEGHFHVRVGNGCMPAGQVLPVEDHTLHVGSGESTKEVTLDPGTYELCAQIGDGFHVAVNVTDTITIEVVE